MECNGYQTIDLKISNQTLEKYERWWRCYISIYSGTISSSSRGVMGGGTPPVKSSVKRPVNDTC